MDFLQSKIWREFQKAAGHAVFEVDNISIIEHQLPIVGKYFYIPRGPEIHGTYSIKHITNELIKLAKENKAGWIRIDPRSKELLENIKKATEYKIVKAPHDMQPKEIFMIDITNPEEQLMAEMKEKTRYNIKLSQKRGVSVKVISNFQFPISNKIPNPNEQNSKKYFEEFLRLVKITSERNEITAHPAEYYRQMWETIPAENLKLYVAEYQGKIIAANLMIFFEDTAIYLHGASDNEYRNVMAPYLLQWQAIKDAKEAGLKKYDFGGVKTFNMQHETYNKENIPNTKYQIPNTSWSGITRFKLGFSKNSEATEFFGSYDIIISNLRYKLYRVLEWMKRGMRR